MFYHSRTAQNMCDLGSQVNFMFLKGKLVHVLPSYKVILINSYVEKQIDRQC